VDLRNRLQKKNGEHRWLTGLGASGREKVSRPRKSSALGLCRGPSTEEINSQRKQGNGENKNRTSEVYCNHFTHPTTRALRSTGSKEKLHSTFKSVKNDSFIEIQQVYN
jgi:hypothetical protein